MNAKFLQRLKANLLIVVTPSPMIIFLMLSLLDNHGIFSPI